MMVPRSALLPRLSLQPRNEAVEAPVPALFGAPILLATKARFYEGAPCARRRLAHMHLFVLLLCVLCGWLYIVPALLPCAAPWTARCCAVALGAVLPCACGRFRRADAAVLYRGRVYVGFPTILQSTVCSGTQNVRTHLNPHHRALIR